MPPVHLSSPLDTATRDRLLDAAREAVARAYAPYSGFHVGAAALLDSGEIFAGANIENASYGLTLCAERAAIACAVAAVGGGRVRLRAVAVQNGRGTPSSPCGACRQVLAEFGPHATVLHPGRDGLVETAVAALLPDAFHL